MSRLRTAPDRWRDPRRQFGFRIYLVGSAMFNGLLLWSTIEDQRWVRQPQYRFLAPVGGARFLEAVFEIVLATCVVALATRRIWLARAANVLGAAQNAYLASGIFFGLTIGQHPPVTSAALALSFSLWGFIGLLHVVIAGLPLSDYWRR